MAGLCLLFGCCLLPKGPSVGLGIWLLPRTELSNLWLYPVPSPGPPKRPGLVPLLPLTGLGLRLCSVTIR